MEQHFRLVKHLSIEIGPEIGVKWNKYLISEGEKMLKQLRRLRSVKITLLGDTARLGGRDCYGEINDEYINIFRLIAEAGLEPTIYGVCFEDNPGLQQKLRHVRLMPGNDLVEGWECTGCWRNSSSYQVWKYY